MTARVLVGAALVRAQLRSLLGLWWTLLRRRPVRVGHAAERNGFPTYLLLNLVWFANFFGILYKEMRTELAPSSHHGPWCWHLLGLVVIAFGAGANRTGLSLGPVRSARSDELLSALPISSAARLGLALADNFGLFLLLPAVPLAGAIAAQRSAFGVIASVLQTVPVSVALFIAGHATAAWLRSLAGPAARRYVEYASFALFMLGMLLLLPSIVRFLPQPTRLNWVVDVWLVPSCAQQLVLPLGAACLGGVAFLALRAGERRGFDQLDAEPRRPRIDKRAAGRLALDLHLIWRLGGKVQLVVWLGVAVALGYASRAFPAKYLVMSLAPALVYFGMLQALVQAGNAIRRDLAARNFLSALPMSPYQLLDGKAAALRLVQLPSFLCLVALAIVAAREAQLAMAVRVLLSALGLALLGSAAISVAFLSHGVGAIGGGAGQGGASFTTLLLTLPLLTIGLARDTLSACVALLALAAVTWEARRAARHSVRWLDDADATLERETAVWRALLALIAFFGTQALSGSLLTLFDLHMAYTLALAFGCSALVLVLLSWRAWGELGRPLLLPERWWAWPLALVGGGATALLSIQLVRWLLPEGAAASVDPVTWQQHAALGLSVVVLAPLAEEYFFRGWLQRAIEHELPARFKRWAFALGALAFALSHVGTYGVPQLLLGLVAGALYKSWRGLGPAMLAHAAHNAVTLLSAALAAPTTTAP